MNELSAGTKQFCEAQNSETYEPADEPTHRGEKRPKYSEKYFHEVIQETEMHRARALQHRPVEVRARLAGLLLVMPGNCPQEWA